ncbi:MAG: hypothetical protein ACYC3X_16825 [Pirellulaceae bacterium]
MKASKVMHVAVVALTCLSSVSADLARAAGPAGTKIRDVSLQSAGVLRGEVVNAQGVPRGDMQVTAVQNGQALAVAQTDPAGRFQLVRMTAGVYELQTAGSSDVYRLWAPRTAPPAAQDSVLLVAGEQVVVRQNNPHPVLGPLANPWVIGGIVAAAVAIPLAISSRHNGS